MAGFVKGEVVIVPFPFSDLSSTKRRPALVLANLPGDDIILCQITSKNSPSDPFSIPVDNSNFLTGSLVTESNIRPNRIFTADKRIILKSIGVLEISLFKKVTQKIIDILN
jgi:mRNA interferase MazF